MEVEPKTEVEETNAELPTAAETLGITQEAFDSVGVALKENQESVEVVEPVVAPKAEAKPAAEAPKDDKKPGESVAQGWAAIKKAEQSVLQDRVQLRKELQEVKRLREQLATSQKSQNDIVSLLKQDPRNLEKLGIPMKEFLERVISEGAPTHDSIKRETNEEVTTLKGELAELKNLLIQSQTNSAEEKFRGRFESALAKPEYELLASHPKAFDEAIKFATAYYQENGRMDLTPEDIARHLQDTWREELTSLRSAKAVRKVFGLPDEPSEEDSDGEDVEQEPKAPLRKPAALKAKPKTVTPTMASSPARGAPQAKVSRQSDEDIVREAAKLVPQDAWEQVD